MFAQTYGSTTFGVNGILIQVEVDVANGLPGFEIVGLPDAAVKESKERVRTAIKNSGVKLRQEKITINLAPADIKKDSSGLFTYRYGFFSSLWHCSCDNLPK